MGERLTLSCKIHFLDFYAQCSVTLMYIEYGTKSRNYRKQPHWALHKYLRRYKCKSTKHSTWEIALHVPQIATTE
jgi:hypothetical protein